MRSLLSRKPGEGLTINCFCLISTLCYCECFGLNLSRLPNPVKDMLPYFCSGLHVIEKRAAK